MTFARSRISGQFKTGSLAAWFLKLALVVMFIAISAVAMVAQNGTALQFNAPGPDQEKQFVNFGANLKLGDPTINSGAFTIETWFKREGQGKYAMLEYPNEPQVFAVPLIARGNWNNTNYFLGIDFYSRVLVADFDDIDTSSGHPIYGHTILSDDKWYHAAAVYDGSTWFLYLDGNLEATQEVGKTPKYDAGVNTSLASAISGGNGIGEWSYNGWFQGSMDEVRFWTVARTAQQLSDNKGKEIGSVEGLVARYGLNEGSGTVAHDSSGSVPAFDGALMSHNNDSGWGNPATWVTGSPFQQGRAKLADRALALNVMGNAYMPGNRDPHRTSTSVDLGTNPAFGLSNFTIEAWVNWAGGGDWYLGNVKVPPGTGKYGSSELYAIPIVEKGGDWGGNYFFGLTGGVEGAYSPDAQLVAFFQNQYNNWNFPLVLSTQRIPRNTWHHVAVTFDGIQLQLYIDGVLDGQTATNGAFPNPDSAAPFGVGAGVFAGTLEQVHIWDYARSLAQIADNRSVYSVTHEPGLVSRWAMDGGATPIVDLGGTSGAGPALSGTNWVFVPGVPPPFFNWIDTDNAPTVTDPGAQTNNNGDAVSLQIVASDVDNDALAYSASGLPPGLAIFSGSGLITGRATADGTYNVTVTVDDNSKPVTQPFVWTITHISRPPVAVDDNYNMVSESALSIPAPGVLVNDTDSDGQTLTVALSAAPTHGTLILNANGSFLYTPTVGFSGTDTFSYQTTNGQASSNTATVSIHITPRNYPPTAPVLVAPQDGAIGVPTPAALDVIVSDPNLEQVTAKFYGKKVSGLASDFTVVMLPDTQFYSQTSPETFNAQTQWVVDNREKLNIKFVTQDGDITNGNSDFEWQNASYAMGLLDAAGIPNNFSLGNHDCCDGTQLWGSAGFDKYFPVSRYAYLGSNYGYLGSDPVGDAPDMPRDAGGNILPNGNRSNYELFSSGYLDFIILHLELDTPNGGTYPSGGTAANVLHWADRILTKYSNRKAMITTHVWIEPSGGRAYYPFMRQDGTGTSAEQVWQQLVSQHCNVFMTGNGHDSQGSGDEGMRIDNNVCGQPVYQIMFDPEIRDNWFGDGWLRYYTFHVSQNTIEGFTYSPTLNAAQGGTYEEDPPVCCKPNGAGGGHFTLPFDMGAPTYQLIDTKTVPSGEHASITWTGLDENMQYSWHVEVSDGVNAPVASPNWNFTTALANRAPVANNGAFTTDQNVAKEFALSATDADGDALTYSIVAAPSHGVLNGAAPSVTYTPAAGYHGTDSFTFKVNDGKVDSNVATVSITTLGNLTVSATNETRSYGDPNPVFTGTISGLMDGDDITATFSSTADASSVVSSYSIIPTLVDPAGKLGNYKVTSNNGTLTVTAVPLTVTADDAIRLFGEPNPTFTGTITGMKNGDTITATFASTATLTSPVGTYPIVPTLVDPTNRAGNYTLVANSGTLTIQSRPAAVSVTPNAGSGGSQLFHVIYSDPAGFAAVAQAATIISSVRSYGTSCAALYTASTDSIQLKDDSGLNWSAAAKLGVAGVLQNTQCSIDAGASSAAGVGTTLTLNYAVTFKPVYAGAKNIYMIAYDDSGLNSGWQALGTWTVPASAPSVSSVMPSTGTGESQLFQLSYSDPAGFAAINTAQTIFSAAQTYGHSCAFLYTASTGSIQMKDDSGLNWSAAAKLGVAGVLQNTQCSIDVGTSSAVGTGNNLALSYAVTFKPAYVGTKNIYMYATNKNGLSSGWSPRGTWNVPSNPPTIVSVLPSTGTGASQLFQLTYSDSGGFAAITQTQTIFSSARTYGHSCAFLYTASTGSIQMKDDSGLNWSAAAKLGIAGVIESSQCSIDVGASSAVGTGNNLTVSYAVSFKPAYTGAKNIYSLANNKSGLNSAWQTLGTWTVPASAPSILSVTPNSGVGASQLFQLTSSDPAGFAAITQTQTIYSSVRTYGHSCAFLYTASTGSIQMKDDSGLNWSAAAKLGVAGILENSQCSIDGGASSAVGSGNNLTLNLAVTFKPTYAGAKNIYSLATNKFGLNSGWQTLGTWRP